MLAVTAACLGTIGRGLGADCGGNCCAQYAECNPGTGNLCCAGLTGFLKERFDEYFHDTYNGLLAAYYATPEAAAAVTWDEAEEALRAHIATGGLDVRVRRQLFDEHRARLGVQGVGVVDLQ